MLVSLLFFCSGLAYSRNQAGILYTIVDKGGPAIVFALNEAGDKVCILFFATQIFNMNMSTYCICIFWFNSQIRYFYSNLLSII